MQNKRVRNPLAEHDTNFNPWWENVQPELDAYLETEHARLCEARKREINPSPKELAERREFVALVGDGLKAPSIPAVKLCKATDFYSRFYILSALGGKPDGVAMAFGDHSRPNRDTILRFMPTCGGKKGKGTLKTQFGSRISDDALRVELSQGGCGLWDKAKNAPGIEYAAIQEVFELHARWKAPDAKIDYRDLHEVFTVVNQLAKAFANPNKFSLALKKREKIQARCQHTKTSFGSPIESEAVQQIKNGVIIFAGEFERPPAHGELLRKLGWSDDRAFRAALCQAGLSWLPRQNRLSVIGKALHKKVL